MENEIELNEYVRTKYGEIGIVTGTHPRLKWRKKKASSDLDFNSIVKHSPNLIDIIELDDCVKLFMEDFVDEGKVKEDTNIFEVIAITTDKKEIGVFTKDFEIEFFPIENIREIYPQEMMESISYKVKE